MEGCAPVKLLTDLPLEILCHIFGLIPVNDRKQIRLTCRRFYDACNCAPILRGEFIICEGNDTTIRTLTNSSRNLWNLELNNVHLVDKVELFSFFDKHGANIRSLTLNFTAHSSASGIIVNIFRLLREALASFSLIRQLRLYRLNELCRASNVKPASKKFNDVINSIVEFNKLEVFSCLNVPYEFDDNLLASLLSNNRNLRCLELQLRRFKNLTFNFLQSLVASKLTTLMLNFFGDNTFVDFDFTTKEDLLPNFQLKTLLIAAKAISTSAMLYLTDHFRALQELDLFFYFSPWFDLKRILMYQTDLRYLTLTVRFGHSLPASAVNDVSMNAESDPICHKKLRKLVVHMWLEDLYTENNTIGGCLFPNLKELSATLLDLSLMRNPASPRSSRYFEAFLRAVQQSTLIESFILYLQNCNPSFDSLLLLCQKLSKLRYLKITGDFIKNQLRDSEYRSLFQVCPSLRTVIHGTSIPTPGTSLAYFYYDETTKSVIKKTLSGLKCFKLFSAEF